MLKLKLKKKKSKKEVSLSKQKSESSQRLALHALQKQLQVLKLKEWLILFGFIGGAALLRVPMQAVPSAEPLTFFAILAGWLFGKKKGFLAGASSLYISNFLVFGGQGPWTIFQALGFGIAGFLGGFIPKFKADNYKRFWISSMPMALIVAFASTLIFDIMLNASWSVVLGGNIFLALITGLPFLLIHLVSNAIFAVFLPFAKKFVYDKGGFNEKEICNTVISNINNRMRAKQ